MALTESAIGSRFLPSTDEAGTSPGDRKFRPDVEGLRAVAVVLVILFHAGVPGLGGGFVGVDVFFVISGFVITGVLLRERASEHRTSLLAFYGRRCRRILPAACLVIVVTCLVAYAVLGVLGGNQTDVDGRWSAVFLANFHFISLGTNYLTASQPPSPLQNFWSLAVEEQFYLVYPTLFLIAAWAPIRLAFRARLAIGLTLAIGASFLLSVVQTSNSPTTAYFSPFTRAWELALGALIAISTPVLLRMPRRLAPAITWVGTGAVIVAAVTFTTATAYPGWRVAVPVVGSALIIAGGTPVPRFGAEWLLRTAPFRHLGKLSFSLYLWHWPILILAAEADGMTTVPLAQAIGWLALAYVAALATYHLVEDPIRHYRRIIRNRWASVGLGIVLTGATLCTLIVLFQVHGGNREVSAGPVAAGGASPQQVQRLVASSVHVQAVPRDLTPAIWGGPSAPGCFLSAAETTAPACVFGDTHGDRTMIVYGDSHAAMWFQTLDDIATGAGWRLMILSKGSCPAELLPFVNPPGVGPSGGEFRACAQWHAYAVRRINQVKPNLVVVTQEAGVGPHDSGTRAEWQTGLSKLFAAIHVRAARLVVLGNIPLSPKNGTACVEEHPTNLPICAGHIPDFYSPWRAAEQRAAAVAHAQYIDTLPWFCSQGICPAVIGHYSVYFDRYHVTAPYARYLETVLGDALHLQPTTELLVPSPNAVLTGSRIPLAAEVSDNASVRSLQFVLTGHDHRTVVIAKGTRTVIGYLATWNSLRAPNGRYSMQSRVTNAAGDVEYSPKVPVRVRNLRGAPPPGRLPTAQSGLNAVKLGGENPLALLSFQSGLEHDRTERQAFGT